MLCSMPSRPPGAAPRILVADDDDLLSEVLSQSLQFHGYQVSRAPHGLISPILAADVDLVILDANIPGADFPSTLQSLHRMKTAVLVLSGEPSPPVGVQEEQYLAKPVDLEQLLAAVERLSNSATEG
jgi:two-component system, OmpR family, response regulator